jgi:hypothetical protein
MNDDVDRVDQMSTICGVIELSSIRTPTSGAGIFAPAAIASNGYDNRAEGTACDELANGERVFPVFGG